MATQVLNLCLASPLSPDQKSSLSFSSLEHSFYRAIALHWLIHSLVSQFHISITCILPTLKFKYQLDLQVYLARFTYISVMLCYLIYLCAFAQTWQPRQAEFQ